MEKSFSMEQLRAENEELQQELHVVKSKYEVVNNTIIDLSEELEQTVAKSNREKEQIRLKYENLLKSQELIIATLKADIQEKHETVEDLPVPTAPTMFDEQELSRIKQEWENEEKRYQVEVTMLQQKLMSNTSDLSQAKRKISEITEELQIAKEHLECKTSELVTSREEANELRSLLEAAQQQNAMLSAELAGIRSGSHNENTKGNSLFGEVADQRNKLMAIISKMKTSYIRLKQEHADCPRQIRQLSDMNQQSERLYRQCISLIKTAEYEHVITLNVQNSELHDQLDKALNRIHYLENVMASGSADWVNKLVLYYTEEMMKLESSLRSCQFRQREAMELRENAVKDGCMWRLEVQRLKLKLLDIESQRSPPLCEAEGPSQSDTEIPTPEEVKPAVEICDKENKGKEGNSVINRPEMGYKSHKEGSGDDAACVAGSATVLPQASRRLLEANQQTGPDVGQTKFVPLKCYKIGELMTLNKGLNNTQANTPDANTEDRSSADTVKENPLRK